MPGPASTVGKPIVTANQVTFARLILLPLGCWLLYAGETGQWVALVAMTIVGCTDFVDGWLARKYGPTVLGGLMDPIADKVFVALTMLPALNLGWLPTSVVTLIFLREFVITAARTAYSRRNVPLRTSYLAKVKTWFQMILIGLLFLLRIAHTGTRFVLGVGAVGAVVGGIIFYLVKRRPWRGSVAFAISFGGLYAIGLYVDDDMLATVLGWITVAITWASGGAYLAGLRDLPGTGRVDRDDAVRLFGAVALPLIGCPLVGLAADAGVPAWPVFSAMALEFAVGGLDNLLAHQRDLPGWLGWGVRVGVQAALLGAALGLLVTGGSRDLIFGLELGALAVTTISTATVFYVNRSAYLDADKANQRLED